MHYPEFRMAEMTVMPWHGNTFRIDIESGTFDGQYNLQQKQILECEINQSIENLYSNICMKLECGETPHKNSEKINIEILDGGSEDNGGLVQLCVNYWSA